LTQKSLSKNVELNNASPKKPAKTITNVQNPKLCKKSKKPAKSQETQQTTSESSSAYENLHQSIDRDGNTIITNTENHYSPPTDPMFSTRFLSDHSQELYPVDQQFRIHPQVPQNDYAQAQALNQYYFLNMSGHQQPSPDPNCSQQDGAQGRQPNYGPQDVCYTGNNYNCLTTNRGNPRDVVHDGDKFRVYGNPGQPAHYTQSQSNIIVEWNLLQQQQQQHAVEKNYPGSWFYDAQMASQNFGPPG
jgi:hypothetical protein